MTKSKIFVPVQSQYDQYFLDQARKNNLQQTGGLFLGSSPSSRYYSGFRHQNQLGFGLGSFFSSLFKSATPLLKKTATNLAPEILQAGKNFGENILSGKSVSEAAKIQLNNSLHKAKEAAKRKITEQLGQFGSGQGPYSEPEPKAKKQKKAKSKTVKRSGAARANKSTAKRKRRDIFDLWLHTRRLLLFSILLIFDCVSS